MGLFEGGEPGLVDLPVVDKRLAARPTATGLSSMTGMISGRVIGPAWIWTMENPASRTSRSKASTISRSWASNPSTARSIRDRNSLSLRIFGRALREFFDEAVHAVAETATGAGFEEEDARFFRVAEVVDKTDVVRGRHDRRRLFRGTA